jgi:hypothetical protein
MLCSVTADFSGCCRHVSLVFFAPRFDSTSNLSYVNVFALTRIRYAPGMLSSSVLGRPQHLCGFPFWDVLLNLVVVNASSYVVLLVATDVSGKRATFVFRFKGRWSNFTAFLPNGGNHFAGYITSHLRGSESSVTPL